MPTAYNSSQLCLKHAVRLVLVDLITANALPGLSGVEPRVRKIPSFRDFGANKAHSLPGIVVANSAAEVEIPKENQTNDTWQSVVVAICYQETATNEDELMEEGEDDRLVCRDQIISALVPKRLTYGSFSWYNSEYSGGQIVDWQQFASDKRWVSSLNFRFLRRRLHGSA